KDRVRDAQDNREYSEMPALHAVTSLRVVTENGSYVGNLSTVHIDPETGALSQLEISGGGFMSMFRDQREVPAPDIVSMGTDVVVIPDTYGPQDEKPSTDEQEIAE